MSNRLPSQVVAALRKAVLAERAAPDPFRASIAPEDLRNRLAERFAQRLGIEHSVTQALACAEHVEDAAPLVVAAISEILHLACGAWWVLDRERDVLVCMSTWGQPEAAIAGYLDITRQTQLSRAPDGLVRRAWVDGEPVWLEDLAEGSSFERQAAALSAGLRSAFAFPINAAGEVRGVVEFYWRTNQQPDRDLLDCCRYIGSQIGQFVLRAEMGAKLKATEQRFADTVELAAIGIAHVDEAGRFLHANSFLCKLLGYEREELVGLTLRQISHPEDRNIGDEMRTKLRLGEIASFQIEKRYQHKDGSQVWVALTISLQRDQAGRPMHDITIVQDISARKQAEARVQYLATHDALTGLPNRVMFGEMVNHGIGSARRHGWRCAVMFIDLDRFKQVNDTLGHEAGDALLRELSQRIKQNLRSGDVAARLGGDEFVVLLQELRSAEEAGVVARKLLSAAMAPVPIAGLECRVTASIGISMFPDDAGDEASLMKHADIAMYHAKEEGRNNYQIYDHVWGEQSLERMTLESQLRGALEGQELSLHYQAKLNLSDHSISGVEALLRWNNAELGAVPPSRFIPIAEETGLILPIGRWVLRTACEQATVWQRSGLPPVPVAVNLSPRQLSDPELLPALADILLDTGLDPELLELEVTESSMMQDTERAVKVLTALKSMGVRLAIDDFGTGYSSLAQLNRFPIDTLKVDRSFIRNIPNDAEGRGIAEAIIAMGRTLKLTVVAEGVETDDQRVFLRDLACDQMQGYLFSKPVSAEDFAELLRQNGAEVASRSPLGV
jgi:diguanylate cyclase (GGDEF)-like protein/PAS domain S-box-containing protein